MEYVRAPHTGEECIFCAKPASEDDEANLIVYRGKSAFALMNLFPYNNGHLLIAPYEHLPDLHLLDMETQQEMLQIAGWSMAAMRERMEAGGFNFGANIGTAAGAGIVEHLHFHVVPRWRGDTNFMPVLGHTKVQMDGLQETRKILMEALAEAAA